MHRITTVRRLLLGGLAASLVGLGGFQAAAQQPNQPVAKATAAQAKIGKAGEILVPLGGVVRFTPKPAGFTDLLINNTDVVVAAVDPTDPNAVLLSGRAPGLTTLTVTYRDGKTNNYEVLVQADYDLLRRVIQRAVPTATVEVIPGVGNSVILTGYVNKLEDADIIMRVAQGTSTGGGGAGGGALNVINAIQVGGVQHVQIEAVIAQVDRTELRQRGVDFQINGTTVQIRSLISGLISPIAGGGGGTAGGGIGGTQAAGNFQLGITPASFFGTLRALKNEGIAKFLSEPKVVTQSGRPAVIRSGGQQATLGQTAGGLGSVSVQLEEIGTTLEVLPIVYGNGKIYLQVRPTIRQVNNAFGIQLATGFSPGFTEQSTSASVMLESGQTFAIGGLLENSVQASSSKLPILGELPFIGFAFSTVTHDERERELLIMVTPRLVDAMDCTQVPKRVPGRESRSPDDYELYLEGLLEAPRGQRAVWNGRCYNAAWKCDTNGLFPCKGNVCTGSHGGACGTAGGCATGGPTTMLNPQPLPPATTAGAISPIDPLPALAPAEATLPVSAPPVAQPDPLPPVVPVTPGEGK